MSLQQLPLELFLEIGAQIYRPSTLTALLKCSQGLRWILEPLLYRRCVEKWCDYDLHWAVRANRDEALKRRIRYNLPWPRNLLHMAACRGSDVVIDTLITSVPRFRDDIHVPFPEGSTPLSAACVYGHLYAVRVLLRHSPKPDLQKVSQDGETEAVSVYGFRMAVIGGHTDIVRELLDAESITLDMHSGMVMARSAEGDGNHLGHKHYLDNLSPIFMAIQCQQPHVLQLLLTRGASANVLLPTQTTALQLAVRNGSTECAELLVRFGADLRSRHGTGSYPLEDAAIRYRPGRFFSALLDATAAVDVDFAIRCKALKAAFPRIARRHRPVPENDTHEDVAAVLLDHITSNATSAADAALHKSSALFAVLEQENFVDAEFLLSRGASLDIKVDGRSCLEQMIRSGSHKGLAFLMARCPERLIADIDGVLPLQYAARLPTDRMSCHLLRTYKLHVNARSADGIMTTALHEAARYGNLCTVASLLLEGADVHLKDSLGNTPLHMAAVFGNEMMVDTMLTAGATLQAATNEGLQPLELAQKYRRKKISGKMRKLLTGRIHNSPHHT